jgi:hypothetical protein
MVQCWRKSRQLAVEPRPEPHCQHWALHEAVRNEHGTTKQKPVCDFRGYSLARTMSNIVGSVYRQRN